MCACVVTRGGAGLTLPELNDFLLQRGIAKFKLPERLQLLDELPTTQVGKVSKPRLVEIVAELARACG
jgi:non-ribosomal peptide synthetase component E (peptide arylation enzyme)